MPVWQETSLPISVSVVVPTYNRCGLIAETLQAITAQTLLPAELIVVDDGSVDGTEEVVRRFPMARYMRVRRGGPGRARNTGVAVATGDWIAFCDSDDLWRPNFLEVFASRIRTGSTYGFSNYVDIIGSDWTELEKFASVPVGFFATPDIPLYENLVEYNPVWPSTVWIKKDFFLSIGGFNEKFSRYATEDFEFTLRCNEYAHPVILHEPLVGIRKHPDNHSRGRIRQHLSDAAILDWSARNHRLGRRYQKRMFSVSSKRRTAALDEAFLLGDLGKVRDISKLIPRSDMSLKTKLKVALSCSRIVSGKIVSLLIGRPHEPSQTGTYVDTPATLET